MSVRDVLQIVKRFWLYVALLTICGAVVGIMFIPASTSPVYTAKQTVMLQLRPDAASNYPVTEIQNWLSRISSQEKFKFNNSREFEKSQYFMDAHLDMENPASLVTIVFDPNVQQFEIAASSNAPLTSQNLLSASTSFVSNQIIEEMKNQFGAEVLVVSTDPILSTVSTSTNGFRWVVSFSAIGIFVGFFLAILLDSAAKNYWRIGSLRNQNLGKIIGPVYWKERFENAGNENSGKSLSIKNAANIVLLQSRQMQEQPVLVIYENIDFATSLCMNLLSLSDSIGTTSTTIILGTIENLDTQPKHKNLLQFADCTVSSVKEQSQLQMSKLKNQLFVFLPFHQVSVSLLQWLQICGQTILIVENKVTTKKSIRNLHTMLSNTDKSITATLFISE